ALISFSVIFPLRATSLLPVLSYSTVPSLFTHPNPSLKLKKAQRCALLSARFLLKGKSPPPPTCPASVAARSNCEAGSAISTPLFFSAPPSHNIGILKSSALKPVSGRGCPWSPIINITVWFHQGCCLQASIKRPKTLSV